MTVEELLELALKAQSEVSGPWRATDGHEIRGQNNVCVAGVCRTQAVTKYLAAMGSPEVVALLEELLALRGGAGSSKLKDAVQEIANADLGSLSLMAVRNKLRAALKE